MVEHGLDQVADAQGFAHCIGQRQAWCCQRCRVEVARAGDAVFVRAIRQQPITEARHQPDRGQHQHAAQAVVEQVKADHQLLGPPLQAVQPVGQRIEKRHHQQQADQFVQQAAQGHAASGRGLQAAGEKGQHAAADIGANHQANGHRQANQTGAGQRRGKQHGGQAGIGNQRKQRADQRIQQQVAGQRGEQHANALLLGDRCGSGDDQLKRQQHQPQPNGHATKLTGAGLFAREKEHHPEKDQQWAQPAQVEGQHAGHQRRADVCTEHDCQRGSQRHQSLSDKRSDQQRGGIAALHQRGHADAGSKGQWALADVMAKHLAQVRAIHPQDAGTDDMGAPDQQGDGRQKIQQGEHGAAPWRARPVAA